MDEELRDPGSLAAAIVRTVREPLLVLDSELHIRGANSAFYDTFAVTPEETVDHPIYEMGNRQWDIPKLRSLLEEIIPEQATFEGFEVEHDFPGLGRRVMLLNARTLARSGEANENDQLILLAIEDVTEREEARRQLEATTAELARSNADLERFAYVASHDLQEPLRMISSYVGLLARRYEGEIDERADKYIRYAVDGAERMKALINALLQYSRVGRASEAHEVVDLDRVLDGVLDNMKLRIQEVGGTVTRDPLPTVEGHRDQLAMVFQNLIANALKFRGEEPPRVEISSREEDDDWVVEVRDNGIGIDPEYFDRVFVIFQRLHTREEYGGTGIGLSLCKKVVERHGGRMWIESEGTSGSTFFFTLPKLREDR